MEWVLVILFEQLISLLLCHCCMHVSFLLKANPVGFFSIIDLIFFGCKTKKQPLFYKAAASLLSHKIDSYLYDRLMCSVTAYQFPISDKLNQRGWFELFAHCSQGTLCQNYSRVDHIVIHHA